MSQSSEILKVPITTLQAGTRSIAVENPGAGGVTLGGVTRAARPRNANTEPLAMRVLLITVALSFLALFLITPVVVIFAEAFRKGWDLYLASIREPDALAAIKLTLITATIAVPLNLVFGVAAAWAIAKFKFVVVGIRDRPPVIGS